VWIFKGPIYFGCGLFCLATNQIAQTGLSSLPPVIYYSEQLFSLASKAEIDPELRARLNEAAEKQFMSIESSP
ncbi:hypothetical protein, partial [Aeromonas caviae]|uniref:hypothetical protein n=1 Tax=Aeromonas caviae TaxID=648 RepID=UPI001C1FA710